MLAELVPEARRRRTASLPLCPTCGSVTDAPRTPAGSGVLRRWCRACLGWCDGHPVTVRGGPPVASGPPGAATIDP